MVKLSDKGSVTKAFSFTVGILFRIVPGYMVLDIILNMLSGTVDAAAAMFFARSMRERHHHAVSFLYPPHGGGKHRGEDPRRTGDWHSL